MPLTTIPLVAVDDPAALWNWVLAKQGVGPVGKPQSIGEAADRSLGLHAARLSSPLVAAAVRVGADVDVAPLVGSDTADLVTVRCMRKTLHTLPFHLASLAHAATRSYRLRDMRRLAERSGVSDLELIALQRKICDFLADTINSSHRDIERAVTPSNQSPIPARIALKLLWERGDVVYRNISSEWLRESRSFSLAAVTHTEFISTIDADVAVDHLIQHYFTRYGPATFRDASWWASIGEKRVAQALTGQDVVQLRLPWAASPFLMMRTEFEAFLRHQHAASSAVYLLGHEDVALKAYFESRHRYLGDLPARKIFNQIGEVLPSLLYQGRVIGGWQWDQVQRRIRFRRFRSPDKDRTRAETVIAVAHLQHRLRQVTNTATRQA